MHVHSMLFDFADYENLICVARRSWQLKNEEFGEGKHVHVIFILANQ